MVLNKIFSKKDAGADINSLKERFSQVGENTPSAASDALQSSSPANNVSVQDALSTQDAPLTNPSPVSSPSPEQVSVPLSQQQPTPEPFGQQPLGFAPAQQAPSPVPSSTLGPVSSPASQQQPSPVSSPSQNPVNTPAQSSTNSMTDLPSWAVESTGEEIATELSSQSNAEGQNRAAETLEQIEDKYYDAKLNSLIIDQVKELIEIDNNLNSKIDDISSEMKKEILEREHLAKKVDQHFDKVKELERNMEKFLGLYEMVTNQFNPFVDKGGTDMFLDDKDKTYPNPVVAPPPTGLSSLDELSKEPTSAPATQQAPPSQPPVQAQPQVQQAPSAPVSNQGGGWGYCPIHHNIHPSMHFELKTGQKLSSIYDVLAVLEQMDDETFSHHVSLKHNDFSNWIYKVLGLTDLGQQLDLIKTRPEMIQSIRSYIQSKMKAANQG
ncbi:MAG: hypothetical protein KC535_05445 [Nanoarchaeota archaeon]|nr:hypothetical protein [Nanoarchaeota archaeon]